MWWGEHEVLSSYVCQAVGLTAKGTQVMEPGAALRLQGQVIRSVELPVIPPIPLMVSCFNIGGFREGFASCCSKDTVGDFWSPLISLSQGS
jgi:hypothetical protein